MRVPFFSESSPAASPDSETPLAQHREPDTPPARPPLQDGRTDFNVVFIHSRLDDYGLTPPAFRIYAHLARRAGQGEAWPGIQSMARVCRLHPQTVRRAVAILIQHRLIERTLRPGLTPLYTLTKASRWQPPRHISDPCEPDTAPSDSEHTPAKRRQGHPSEKNGGKGNPLEGTPRKNEIHTPRAPGSIPCNESEAVETAKLAGIPEDFARTEFNRMEAVNWLDGCQRQVRSWPHYIKQRWSSEQSERAERQTRAATRPGRTGGFVPPRKFDTANYQQTVKDL